MARASGVMTMRRSLVRRSRSARCVEGKAGERLLADQRALRERLTNDRRMVITPEARATAALVEARRLGFVDDETDHARS